MEIASMHIWQNSLTNVKQWAITSRLLAQNIIQHFLDSIGNYLKEFDLDNDQFSLLDEGTSFTKI